MQMELLNARADTEQARIELSMAKEVGEGLSNRSISSLNVPKQTLHETVGKYLESFDEVSRSSKTPLQQPERTPDFLAILRIPSMFQKYKVPAVATRTDEATG